MQACKHELCLRHQSGSDWPDQRQTLDAHGGCAGTPSRDKHAGSVPPYHTCMCHARTPGQRARHKEQRCAAGRPAARAARRGVHKAGASLLAQAVVRRGHRSLHCYATGSAQGPWEWCARAGTGGLASNTLGRAADSPVSWVATARSADPSSSHRKQGSSSALKQPQERPWLGACPLPRAAPARRPRPRTGRGRCR